MNTRCLNISFFTIFFCLHSVSAKSISCTNALAQISLGIQNVLVNNEKIPISSASKVNLGMHPEDISFQFGAGEPGFQAPIRLQAKLEGFENDWHGGNGYMFMALRFFNANGDQITQTNFPVWGNSPGWNGLLESSPWIHRHESIIVPPLAAHVWVVISSAGPPTTVGIYVVTDLTLADETDATLPIQLLKPLSNYQSSGKPVVDPAEWQQDGTHKSMAKIICVSHSPPKLAMAIVDDDATAHAEWHNVAETSPAVHPGERLTLDWNEIHSIGDADWRNVDYSELPPGTYHFRIIGLTLMGQPDGHEASIAVFVPMPFWKRPSTLMFTVILFVAVMGGGIRYLTWLQMRRQLLVLKNQQAMEQERLRIARDIHDDLGARVTQISILAASSLDNANNPDVVKVDLHQIKQISRDLVSALYETVWMVNPEYDNLTALGDYLCQMVDKSCKRASLRCRTDLSLPTETFQISGHVRHNLAMAVKEAINNTIKHSQCSEIAMRVTFNSPILQIKIQDNGIGFACNKVRAGNGLKNMRHRLADMGGECAVESEAGKGTKVVLRFVLTSLQLDFDQPKNKQYVKSTNKSYDKS